MEGIPTWAVVSITNTGDKPANLSSNWKRVLPLQFDDVDGPHEGSVEMSASHAREIVRFVREVAPRVEVLLVHCHAGLSRSAAVAKFVADEFELEFPESYALYNRFVYRQLNRVLWAERYGEEAEFASVEQ